MSTRWAKKLSVSDLLYICGGKGLYVRTCVTCVTGWNIGGIADDKIIREMFTTEGRDYSEMARYENYDPFSLAVERR